MAIPLSERSLGPAFLTVQVANTTFGGTTTVGLNVTGVLAFSPGTDPIVLTAPSRQPVVAVLGLCLASPGNASQQAPVNDGRVPVQGMTVAFDGQFARVAEAPNGTYTTLLPVSPLSQDDDVPRDRVGARVRPGVGRDRRAVHGQRGLGAGDHRAVRGGDGRRGRGRRPGEAPDGQDMKFVFLLSKF